MLLAILDHRESDLLIGRGMSIIQRSTNLDIPGKQVNLLFFVLKNKI